MLSEALRLIRVFHDLKQVEAAEKLGISKSHLSEIERGMKTPSLEVIERYSKQFGIPMSSIMFFSENIEKAGRGEKGFGPPRAPRAIRRSWDDYQGNRTSSSSRQSTRVG